MNEKEIVKAVKITVSYSTNISSGMNDFNSLQELKLWLDKHSLLAEKLGYVLKKK